MIIIALLLAPPNQHSMKGAFQCQIYFMLKKNCVRLSMKSS
jgi:hypothetical protein